MNWNDGKDLKWNDGMHYHNSKKFELLRKSKKLAHSSKTKKIGTLHSTFELCSVLLVCQCQSTFIFFCTIYQMTFVNVYQIICVLYLYSHKIQQHSQEIRQHSEYTQTIFENIVKTHWLSWNCIYSRIEIQTKQNKQYYVNMLHVLCIAQSS